MFMEVIFTALWNLDRLLPNDRRREVAVLLGNRYMAISISTLMDVNWDMKVPDICCLCKVALLFVLLSGVMNKDKVFTRTSKQLREECLNYFSSP